MPGFIKLRVKSLWEKKVAIRDRYLADAKARKVGIQITHKDRVMLIPYEKLDEKVLEVSKELFWDKFKGSAHRLVYFLWEPTDGEQRMLI